jgi:hypothetical protein
MSELGLTLRDAKTRIVALREGGEGLDFLGFHHRWVRGNTPASKHVTFLARWPSQQAMARARSRIRELTDRSRLREPVEDIVHENSANAFDKITFYAFTRLEACSPSATIDAPDRGGASSAPHRIKWD